MERQILDSKDTFFGWRKNLEAQYFEEHLPLIGAIEKGIGNFPLMMEENWSPLRCVLIKRQK